MTLRLTPILVCAISLLASCNAERTEEHPDFIGNWNGRDADCGYRIEINDNNTANWGRQCDALTQVEGGFKVISEGTQVRIAGKKFDIIVYPIETIVTDTGSFWQMDLDNIQYTTFK